MNNIFIMKCDVRFSDSGTISGIESRIPLFIWVYAGSCGLFLIEAQDNILLF